MDRQKTFEGTDSSPGMIEDVGIEGKSTTGTADNWRGNDLSEDLSREAKGEGRSGLILD